MSLKKVIVIGSIGVPASHHVIRRYTVDLNAKTTAVEIASFYDAEVAANGAQAIGMANVSISEVPPKGADLLDFCERKLAEPVPADAGTEPTSAGSPNRYLFADAEIVS